MNRQEFMINCIHAYNKNKDNALEEFLYENKSLEKVYSLMNCLSGPLSIDNISFDGEDLVLKTKDEIDINTDTSFYDLELNIMTVRRENESIIYIKRR